MKTEKVTRRHEEGGGNRTKPSSFFNSVQLIDMKLGMRIGFHGNRSIEMTFPSVKIVFFIDIQSKLDFFTEANYNLYWVNIIRKHVSKAGICDFF